MRIRSSQTIQSTTHTGIQTVQEAPNFSRARSTSRQQEWLQSKRIQKNVCGQKEDIHRLYYPRRGYYSGGIAVGKRDDMAVYEKARERRQ